MWTNAASAVIQHAESADLGADSDHGAGAENDDAYDPKKKGADQAQKRNISRRSAAAAAAAAATAAAATAASPQQNIRIRRPLQRGRRNLRTRSSPREEITMAPPVGAVAVSGRLRRRDRRGAGSSGSSRRERKGISSDRHKGSRTPTRQTNSPRSGGAGRDNASVNFPTLKQQQQPGRPPPMALQKKPSIGGLRAAIANRAGLRSSGGRGLPKTPAEAAAASSAAAAARRRSYGIRRSAAEPALARRTGASSPRTPRRDTNVSRMDRLPRRSINSGVGQRQRNDRASSGAVPGAAALLASASSTFKSSQSAPQIMPAGTARNPGSQAKAVDAHVDRQFQQHSSGARPLSASAQLHRKQQALSSFAKVKIKMTSITGVETDSAASSPRGKGRESAASDRVSVHPRNPPPLVDQNGELWTRRDSLCGEYGVAAVQGRRPYMEDRHVISVCPASQIHDAAATDIYAVFDGHGGKKCSSLLARLADKYLRESQHFAVDVPKACKEAFLALDRTVLSKGWEDGSTGCAVLVRQESFWCANTGDSRAVLFAKNKAIPLSKDHKPNNPAEKRRILKAGGSVDFCLGVYRVNSCLAVARAFGDSPLKPYGVTAMPDVVEFRRSPKDDFIIVASDGLFDVMSNDEACRFVKRGLKGLGNRLSALGDTKIAVGIVADKLVKYALSKGSQDNITAIIVLMQAQA